MIKYFLFLKSIDVSNLKEVGLVAPLLLYVLLAALTAAYFGEGGWCDSWYTSVHPEKGTFTFNDIIKIYDENPHVKEMMLTGGSPTMHPKLVNELTHFANERGISLLSRLKVLISSKPIIRLVSFLSHLSLVIVSLLLGPLLPMGQSQMKRWLKRTIVFALILKPLERVLIIILTITISLCGMGLIAASLKSKLTDTELGVPKDKTYVHARWRY